MYKRQVENKAKEVDLSTTKNACILRKWYPFPMLATELLMLFFARYLVEMCFSLGVVFPLFSQTPIFSIERDLGKGTERNG